MLIEDLSERIKLLGEAAREVSIHLDIAAPAANVEPKRIYLSGKISGLYIERTRQNFMLAEREIFTLHSPDEVVNPFNIRPFLGIRSWICYMIADIRELSTCTHAAFMYNWRESRGAVIEYFFARFIFKQEIIWLAS
jgi:hypothetical protein